MTRPVELILYRIMDKFNFMVLFMNFLWEPFANVAQLLSSVINIHVVVEPVIHLGIMF
jgi:hypothetical protein